MFVNQCQFTIVGCGAILEKLSKHTVRSYFIRIQYELSTEQ